jgi:hypothetical protein
MSYFNELAGGPTGGHRHIIDANIDWGQDLYFLKEWQRENPHAKPFYLAYFGSLDPAWLAIDFTLPPQIAPRESSTESKADPPNGSPRVRRQLHFRFSDN